MFECYFRRQVHESSVPLQQENLPLENENIMSFDSRLIFCCVELLILLVTQ